MNPALLAMAALSAVFMGLQLYFCGAGIEFTDESYCLLYTANPRDYPNTPTMFGFLYRPFFSLFGESVWLLRSFSSLSLAAASMLFFWLTVCRTSALSPVNSFLLATVASSSSASFYTLWLPSPSYNSLNFLGLLVTASGMLLAVPAELNSGMRKRGPMTEGFLSNGGKLGWILVGAGGWLCFIAKPPTALALAAIVLIWAVPAGGYSSGRLLLAIGSALGLCLLTALLTAGTPASFLSRYANALQDLKVTGTGAEYGFFATLKPSSIFQSGRPRVIPLATALLATGAILAMTSGLRRPFPGRLLKVVALVIFFLAIALDRRGIRHSLVQGWAPLPLFSGILAFMALNPRRRLAETFSSLKRPSPMSMTAIFLLTFPLIYGFGSNSPLPISSSSATAFLVGAFLAHALARKGSVWLKIAISAVFLCQLMSLSGLASSWAAPFRQGGPLWEMPDRAPLAEGGPSLRLPRVPARLLAQLHVRARLSGLRAGTTVIDLTGVYPLAVYAVSGRSYSSPFLVAGYSWSDGFARAVLRRTSCEAVSSAWLIWTDKPYFTPIDPKVLSEVALDFPSGYRSAFSIPGYWGDGRGEGEELHFLEPVDPHRNLNQCLAKRKENYEKF
jgi:hypothetical protein